ncbi:MAG TPA: selenide, water dikinase SelD, partial [Bacillota bacterium]|nr:selenide, water dikinase SelD [Bacillota bacterium]
VLQTVLEWLPMSFDRSVLVGHSTSDDAGVYLMDESTALVQTLDFFTPMTDDPYLFGQIAAANSLSDVYAMGGKPLTALNIVCYATCVDIKDMGEILRGAADKAAEAGVVILGGHSVENADIKFGMSVTGVVHPERIVRNAGLKPGHKLILTKPVGSGIVLTAHKAGFVDDAYVLPMLTSMAELNRVAAEILLKYDVSGGTDITGFGLLGHTAEMAQGSRLRVSLDAGTIPLFRGALEYAAMGMVPAGSYRNREHFRDCVSVSSDCPVELQDALWDPQTSGGLLFAVAQHEAQKALDELVAAGLQAAIIGTCHEPHQSGLVVVTQSKI